MYRTLLISVVLSFFTLGAQAQLSPPVDLELSLSEGSPSKGQQVAVTLKVTPRISLHDATVRFNSEKGVSIQGDKQIDIGSLKEGRTKEYSTSILLLQCQPSTFG